MYSCDNYGVVYTPRKLAAFVADLIIDEGLISRNGSGNNINILDPACGEGILLEELKNKLKRENVNSTHCFGVDVDSNVITSNKNIYDEKNYTFIMQNSILPSTKITAYNYWIHRLKNISCVIANPPWSSEKIFSREDLNKAGYQFDVGQYDSYVLFIELCLKIVHADALLAFIIPDSLFSGENKALRKFLLENTEIKIVARLGEKLFPNVNRATSVIILKNRKPNESSKTKCYRLDTSARKDFLEGKLELHKNFNEKYHTVLQSRFLENQNYVFDIDAREEEEILLNKIEIDKINWKKIFRFGRGVEISKLGTVVTCEHCGMTQGYSKKQPELGVKKCQFCEKEIILSNTRVFKIISDTPKKDFTPMYVGENLHRYHFDGIRYIRPNIKGINYKDEKQYHPPKILIRKTGLGIYACIDYQSTYTSQTIYSVNYLDNKTCVPLEYYLGVLNSRLIYYYYLKKYGENEWKSHPYLTKDIVFSLPIKSVTKANFELILQIAEKVKMLQGQYNRELDMEIEKLVMELYEISNDETAIICEELNSLPDLSAINQMKLKDGELYV